MRGLTSRVADILDRRLAPASPAPIAVALSGGGDSVALTLMAADWAMRRSRRLAILTVDHRLNAASAGWTGVCADLAARLSCDFHALAWTGEKPRTGLPAAARAARHRLLADAARGIGARVVLLGHTADDRAEGQTMRAEGSTTPDPREWSPSPAWPEGRGLFLLRPLLNLGRGDLRAWLAARGETWIEDPANADPRFARARARLAGVAAPGPADPDIAGLADLALRVRDETGLSLTREDLRRAAPDTARALTGIACLCASGTTRPPRGERLDRLTQALRDDAPVVATLAGARIEADAQTVRWLRQAGEIGRHGSGRLDLGAGETGVWDGRFDVRAERQVSLRPLAGYKARLSPIARGALAPWPVAARGGLPLVDDAACPVIEAVPGLTVRALALERLLAACGVVDREPD
jgi:tRNA(Ile)-lysidine synthase